MRFLRIEKQYQAESESPRAESHYVYDVDGQEVLVAIDGFVFHDWNVTQNDVKQACEAFIEAERARGWSPNKPGHLTLDRQSIEPIAEKLHWKRK